MRTARRLLFFAALLTVLLTAATARTASHHSRYYKQAKRIIYAVFPSSTAAAALRVVGCETGYTYSPWSYNRSSGASGYFQVLQGNAGRVLRYGGKALTIPSGSALFLPWTNARVALFLSKGGTDWGEWSCSP